MISRLFELPFSFFEKRLTISSKDMDKLSTTTTTLLVALVTAAAVILSALTNRNICGCDISFDYIVVKETERGREKTRRTERERERERAKFSLLPTLCVDLIEIRKSFSAR